MNCKAHCRTIRIVLFLSLSVFLETTRAQPLPIITDSTKPQAMSIDVKETDIADVIRTISKGYNLNIILDKNVTGKVTLHLTDVPIMEGLRSLAGSNGLEVAQEGSVYYIRKPVEQQKTVINYSRGKLTVDVQNMDVRDFLQAISSQTAISIVPDSKVTGKISGKLYQVDVEDGLRGLLEGNGFTVTKRKNIYQVALSGSDVDNRMSPMRGPAQATNFYVDYSDGKISLDVSNGDLDAVIKAIAQRSDMQIITYGEIRSPLNVRITNMPLTEALALMLGGTRFTFVMKDNIILIGDRNSATPSGQALSKSELIPCNHVKADDAFKILPRNIRDISINVVKEQNALLVTGTSEDIVNVKEFLRSVDIQTPQVVINVLVVEYTRNLEDNFGIQYGGGAPNDATNKFSFPSVEYSRKGGMVKDFLKTLGLSSAGANSFSNKLNLDDNFYFALRLLENDQKAKVLAKPSITVLNGNKATINVGQSQYFKVVTGFNEQQNIKFQEISFGISLDIEPWISPSGQITATIKPDISNSMGINNDGYPNIFKRSVSTTVQLDNNQTLVLGGLLRSEQQTSEKKVPFLGDIPIIGYLFKTTYKTDVQTNLAIYITPVIIEKGTMVDLKTDLGRMEKKKSTPVSPNDFFPITPLLKKDSLTHTDILSSTVPQPKESSHTDTLPVVKPASSQVAAPVRMQIRPSGNQTDSLPDAQKNPVAP